MDLERRAKDVRLLDVPGYIAWSKRKLSEGGNEAYIAHLDSMSMWLLPEDVGKLNESDFEEMLEEIRDECG
jgi:hypothetical protein